MKNKNILILSYFFPPCNKVGGRRWAKFAKVLSERQYKVCVVCVDFPLKGNCPWEKDVTAYKANITRLPYIEHRPYYQVNKSPKSIAGKMRYRLSWYSRKLKGGEKKFTDISEKYGAQLRAAASRQIEKNSIDTVIVTGGPFHWCYEAMQLKQQFPRVRFLLDLRDFWTAGEGYLQLDRNEQANESCKEKASVEAADAVFTPAERIAIYLKERYAAQKEKIVTLPHAFDSDEMPDISSTRPMPSEIIKLAYGGILYSNMQASVNRLIDLLKALMEKGKKVKLDIYTFDPNYHDLFERAGLSGVVIYHEPIPPDGLFRLFLECDYLLQLRAGEANEQHFKSTKFYELIALRRPVLYFGPEGDVSEFLQNNKLGFSGNMPLNELCDLIIDNKASGAIPAKDFDVMGYEFRKVTTQLEIFL